MPNFDSRNAFLAAAIWSGLSLMAAGAIHAGEPGGSMPDFSSNDAAWVLANLDYIAVPGGPSPTRNDPAHPYVTNNVFRATGAQPSFRVADLANPNIKPWAKEIMKRENDKVLAGGIPYGARQSCMPAGVPAFMAFAVVEPIHFMQTPKQVTMIFSGDAQVRRVYLDVPHSANPRPSWYGESVGHYEGDTLVVDTIGMNDKTYLDNFRTPHTEKLHVVERYRLVDEGKTLQVTFRVEDPDTFYEPWSAINNFKRVQMPMHEEACAENNQHLFDYHMPVASKADF
ncbi:MAG TPA: hypothetical protein VKT99_20800 [Xanthobacteraceae bacterium]|jgi:hypothetical protein|nr:hypothetical protein [Xanthobacteraceae bacterium]